MVFAAFSLKSVFLIFWNFQKGQVKLSDEHTDLHWGDVVATNQLLVNYKDMQKMVSEAADFIDSE